MSYFKHHNLSDEIRLDGIWGKHVKTSNMVFVSEYNDRFSVYELRSGSTPISHRNLAAGLRLGEFPPDKWIGFFEVQQLFDLSLKIKHQAMAAGKNVSPDKQAMVSLALTRMEWDQITSILDEAIEKTNSQKTFDAATALRQSVGAKLAAK